jgi:hypothetical protein
MHSPGRNKLVQNSEERREAQETVSQQFDHRKLNILWTELHRKDFEAERRSPRAEIVEH